MSKREKLHLLNHRGFNGTFPIFEKESLRNILTRKKSN